MSNSPFYKTGESKSALFNKGHNGKPGHNHGTQRYQKTEVPSYTDSLSVYMQNNAQKQYKMDSSWNDISMAAQDKFGKMNVSNFKPNPKKIHNVEETRAKYNLPQK